MQLNRRLAGAVAGVIAAAGIAIPTGALTAAKSPSPAVPSAKAEVPSKAVPSAEAAPSAKDSPSAKGKAGSSVDPSDLPSIAASAGMSVSRLQAGLVAAKRAGGSNAAGIAAFAAATGADHATAERIVYSVFGIQGDRSLTGPIAAAALAKRLGVSASDAQRALDRIGALSREPDGVDVGSAAFASVANDLGARPEQLAAALDGLKQSMAGK